MKEHQRFARDGFGSLTAEVVARPAERFIDFCREAFGAELLESVPGPGGSVLHATLQLGDTRLFVADEGPMAPRTTSNHYLYVRDADATFQRALAAGAEVTMPMADMPWGDRWGMVRDPFGNEWQIATHVEDVPPDQIAARMRDAAQAGRLPTPARTPAEVARACFETMNAGQWEAYLDLFAEHVVMDEQMAGHQEGKDHVRQAVAMLQRLHALPRFRNDLTRLVANGEQVVAIWHMQLTTAEGQDIECRGANYYEIKHGKIVYMSNYHDTVPYLPLFPNHQR